MSEPCFPGKLVIEDDGAYWVRQTGILRMDDALKEWQDENVALIQGYRDAVVKRPELTWDKWVEENR